jgi:hypothetical protein
VRLTNLGLVVVVALCLSPRLLAQSPAAQPAPQAPSTSPQSADQRPPTFRTGANLVRVDVYPTRDGKPVLDLASADFEILEDGVAQKVDTFEHVVVRGAACRASVGAHRAVVSARDAAGGGEPAQSGFRNFPRPDTVQFEDSHAVAEPLIRLINWILGPDDLVTIKPGDRAFLTSVKLPSSRAASI